jgi:hypothetical protein
MYLKVNNILLILFQAIILNIFPSGVYEGKMHSQLLFLKVYSENDSALLDYLNDKGRTESLVGSLTQDSIFYDSFIRGNEKYMVKVSLKDEKVFVYSFSTNQLIETRKISNSISLELSKIPKLVENNLDPDLIGQWIYHHLVDPNGEIYKDEFSGKGYVETFLENGKWIFDPRAIQDQLRSAGIKDFSYEDLPQMKWRTKNKTLIIESVESTSESTYFIRNDSLFKTSKQGYTTVLVRKK